MTDYTSIALARHQHEVDRQAAIDAKAAELAKALRFEDYRIEILCDASHDQGIEKAYESVFAGKGADEFNKLATAFVERWLYQEALRQAEARA